MKPTKSSMTRKLDKICSEIIRSQGLCAQCEEGNYAKLQCAHIYSRTYRSVRWDLKNLMCLCISCHFHAHKNPVLFTEFVKVYLGAYEYEALKLRAIPIKQWKLDEMVSYYETLKGVQNGHN